MSHKTAATVAHTIGIDTGKNTLHLIGLDDMGAIVLREKVVRDRITARLANVPRCLIGIEAGMATHYVARELNALGHDVKQVPPAYAKPFRQGHKIDFRDAYAIAEAVQRPSTRCVPVGAGQRELSSIDDRSGCRPDHCRCNGGCDRQRHCLCKRARLCGVARPDTEADVHG
jgi:transposase